MHLVFFVSYITIFVELLLLVLNFCKIWLNILIFLSVREEPNFQNLCNLMQTSNDNEMKNIALFVNEIMKMKDNEL